jgi:hypothetical protein
MISTGREYDRFIIAIVIVSVFLLGLYVMKCNSSNSKKMKKQENSMADRMDYLTRQLNKTSKSVTDLLEPKVEDPPTSPSNKEDNDNLPNPVASSFMG